MKKMVGFLFGVIMVYFLLNFSTDSMLKHEEMKSNNRDKKIVMQINENNLPKDYCEFIKIERLYIPISKIEKIFFQNKDKIEKKQFYNGNKVAYTISNDEGKFLDYNDENILYYTKDYEKISQYFGLYPNSNLDNGKMYNRKIELSFATLDEAYKEIFSILEDIGISSTEFDYEYFVIDYDSLKKVEKKI